MFVA
jgi:C-terminal processing protease CtpA/Prc